LPLQSAGHLQLMPSLQKGDKQWQKNGDQDW
jgi:hypothetical protein